MKHPQILSLLLGNLGAKRDYFDGIDRVNEECPAAQNNGDASTDEMKPTLAARILASAPSVFLLSLKENIVPKVEYLAALCGNQ